MLPYRASGIASPVSEQELLAFLQRELQAIETALSTVLLREIEFLHAAPARLRDGLTVGADGTDWNPGSGQGVYTYYASAWHKLG